MDDRFSILFFPKGDSRGKDGKTSIYLELLLMVNVVKLA